MVGLELLKGHEFIGNLKEKEQQLLIANLTKVGYSKGERIAKNGEFVTHAVFVIKGFLKIHADFKSKTVILDICGPNSFSGLSFMIGNEKHAFDISSVDDSMVYLSNM